MFCFYVVLILVLLIWMFLSGLDFCGVLVFCWFVGFDVCNFVDGLCSLLVGLVVCGWITDV